MQPDIARRVPRHLAAGPAHHQHAGIVARQLGQRIVRVFLQGDWLAATHALIGRDDKARGAILDAAGEALGREAAKHHRMHSTDARAGEHGIGRLGDHWQIDGDAVAFAHAIGLQHIGELADPLVQLPVGDAFVLGRIIALPDDGDLVGAAFHVPVDAVG